MRIMDITAWGRWVVGLLWAVLVSTFGPPFANVMIGLMVMMLADTLLAVVANGRCRNIDPTAGMYGSKRKLGTVVFLLAFAVFYRLSDVVGGWDLARFPAPTGAVVLFAAWEFGSILANAKACGMVLPGPLGLLFDWLATMLAPSKMPPPKADVRRQEP